MTPTTTSSIRDYLIDCAIRWQRHNKLIVPRAGAIVAVEGPEAPMVPAVIGPRHANLRTSLVPPREAVPAFPFEQTALVPAAPTPPDAIEPESSPEEAPAVTPEAVSAPEAAEPGPTESAEGTTPAEVAAAVPAAPAPSTAMLSAEAITWQALILSGPAGSGKSSIAQQFCEMLPRSVHIKVEPLRDRAYSVLVAQVVNHDGTDTQPEVWSGKTEEARQQASDLARAYVFQGYCVVIDDVIEAPADLRNYQENLAELKARTITLMPSQEEMERRDKMRPVEQQAGLRIREVHAAMTRELSQHSTVLDTSQETVQETVERIIQLLA